MGGKTDNPQLDAIQKKLDKEIEERKRGELLAEKHSSANSVLAYMSLDVSKKGRSLSKAARRIGKAYSVAASRHRDAIAKQDTIEAMETQILFSCLTIFTSGALSWATELIDIEKAAQAASRIEEIEKMAARVPPYYKNRVKGLAQNQALEIARQESARGLMHATIKDTMSAGLGEVFSAMGPMYAPAPKNEPASIDPLEFQDQLELQVDSLLSTADTFLLQMAEKIMQTPADAWDKYSDRRFRNKYEDWKKQAAGLADDDDLPSDNQMADELERFIWALWVPRLAKMITFYGGTKNQFEMLGEFERVYKPVDDRFVALGIETSDQTDLIRSREDTILINWGQKYLENVKPWISGKAK